jgi:hypothetical protein
MDPLSVLPAEISLHIASYLDEIDLKQGSLISKLWYRVLEDNSLWKPIAWKKHLQLCHPIKAQVLKYEKELILNTGAVMIDALGGIKKLLNLPLLYPEAALPLLQNNRQDPRVYLSFPIMLTICDLKNERTYVLFFRFINNLTGILNYGILYANKSQKWRPYDNLDKLFETYHLDSKQTGLDMRAVDMVRRLVRQEPVGSNYPYPIQTRRNNAVQIELRKKENGHKKFGYKPSIVSLY